MCEFFSCLQLPDGRIVFPTLEEYEAGGMAFGCYEHCAGDSHATIARMFARLHPVEARRAVKEAGLRVADERSLGNAVEDACNKYELNPDTGNVHLDNLGDYSLAQWRRSSPGTITRELPEVQAAIAWLEAFAKTAKFRAYKKLREKMLKKARVW